MHNGEVHRIKKAAVAGLPASLADATFRSKRRGFEVVVNLREQTNGFGLSRDREPRSDHHEFGLVQGETAEGGSLLGEFKLDVSEEFGFSDDTDWMEDFRL